MKKCIKCGELKELFDYHIHKKMGDGHLNKCKVCVRDYVRSHTKEKMLDETFRESEKQRHREKYHRLDYKEKHKPTKERKRLETFKYENKYPEKVLARNNSSHLHSIVKGNHLHHWSYNLEHSKDVIELEPKKHYLLHRHMIYDQSFMMYRDSSGNLLDTKQSHIDLLNKILDEDSR
jgi:hypothetical protein